MNRPCHSEHKVRLLALVLVLRRADDGLGQRERLDEGELCLYAIRAKSRLHLFWAGVRGIFGKLDQQRDFITAYVTEAEIGSDRPTLTLSADGETVRMETPLRYRIRPKALKLIVPEL